MTEQQIFQIIITAFSFLASCLLALGVSILSRMQKSVDKNTEEVTQVRVLIASDYVRKTDYDIALRGINDKLDRVLLQGNHE